MHDKGVRFIKQTDGTFHPKIYIFENDSNDWALLIGSGNFTHAAFSDNSEASILITSDDQDGDKQIKRAKDYVLKQYNDGDAFEQSELSNYTVMWRKRRPQGLTRKRIQHELKSAIYSMTWQDYVNKVLHEKRSFAKHTFEGRLKVLNGIRSIFVKTPHFKDMTVLDRKRIAGLINEGDINWLWFGHMGGCGRFQHQINTGDVNISKALDQIPLNGNITKDLYDLYVHYYKMAMLGDKSIGTASRLLAMKRPDCFVCLDNANKTTLWV